MPERRFLEAHNQRSDSREPFFGGAGKGIAAALDRLATAIDSLIALYCDATNQRIGVPRLRPVVADDAPSVCVDGLTAPLRLRCKSVHRFPADWTDRYRMFQVQFGLYAGGAPLCPVITTPTASVATDTAGWLPSISWFVGLALRGC